MKTTIALLFCSLSLMAGTPRENAPVKAANPIAPPVTVYPQILLTWEPHYDTWSNNAVMTVIIASPDISIPHAEWASVFQGPTNQCTVPMTSTNEFFTAYNTTNL